MKKLDIVAVVDKKEMDKQYTAELRLGLKIWKQANGEVESV